jgi:hypothetical protein
MLARYRESGGWQRPAEDNVLPHMEPPEGGCSQEWLPHKAASRKQCTDRTSVALLNRTAAWKIVAAREERNG